MTIDYPLSEEFYFYDGEPLPPDLDKVLKDIELKNNNYVEFHQKLLDEWCDKWKLSKRFSWKFYYDYVVNLHSLDDRYKDKQAMLFELEMIDPNPQLRGWGESITYTWPALNKEQEKQKQETRKRVNIILDSLDYEVQKSKFKLWGKKDPSELTFYNTGLK